MPLLRFIPEPQFCTLLSAGPQKPRGPRPWPSWPVH